MSLSDPLAAILRQGTHLVGIALNSLHMQVNGVLHAHAAQALQEFGDSDNAPVMHREDKLLPGHEQALLLADGLAAAHGRFKVFIEAVTALLRALAQHIRVAEQDHIGLEPVRHGSDVIGQDG